MHDVNCLLDKLRNDFLGNILQLLHSCSLELLDSVKQSILQAGKSLEDVMPSLLDAIIEAIVEKSAEVRTCY